MDNTLLPFGDAQVSKETICAIRRLMDAGIHFAPATGRGFSDLAQFFKLDQTVLTTAITCNALEIWLDNRPILQKYFSQADLENIARCVCDIDGAALVVTGDDPKPWIIGLHGKGNSKLDSPGAFPSGYILTEELPEIQTVNVGVLFDSDLIRKEDIEQQLMYEVPSLDFLYTYIDWFDVTPKGWSKTQGAQILMDALGLIKEEVVVFGDGVNDLSIISALPHSVAVANAEPVVAAAARYHIGQSADYAVAKAFNQIADVAGTGELPEFMRN